MIKEMCKVLDELNHSIRQSQARRQVHTFQQTLYLACSVHTRVGRGAGILGAQYMQWRAGYNKYLKMEGDVTITIDRDKYEADAVWDGVKGHVTNTKLPEKDVLSSYSNLWFIERAFRMNKGDLRARPIFHRLHNRIEAHICICFTAYTIMLELERLLKEAKSEITIYQAGHLTKTMYQLNYQTPKTHRKKTVILQMDSEQQELYDIVSRKRLD